MKMKFNLLLGLGLLAGGSAVAQNAPKDSAVKQPFATVTCKDSVATNITYHMPVSEYDENKIVLKEMKSYPAGPWGMNHGMGYYYSQKNDKGEIEYKDVKLSMTHPSVRKDVLPILKTAEEVCKIKPNETVTNETVLFPEKANFNAPRGETKGSVTLPTIQAPLNMPTVTNLLETDFQRLKEALIGKPKADKPKTGDKPAL